MTANLSALDAELDAVPGTVSVWCGPVRGRAQRRAAYTRHRDEPHYAASTMKVAVLAALHRAAEAATVDLDRRVPVVNEFASAAGNGTRFGCDPAGDGDPSVWQRLGGTASLRWLAERMIVRSSNLATNLVLGQIGLYSVADVWRLVGARHSTTRRGIEDGAAHDAGITNLVTAADLAALMSTIVDSAERAGPLASPASCAAMVDTLVAQQHRDDLAAGLPPGTRIAHKSGWVTGIRHAAGVVFPADAPPYALAVCTTSTLSDTAASQTVRRVAAASWADRARLTEPADPDPHRH